MRRAERRVAADLAWRSCAARGRPGRCPRPRRARSAASRGAACAGRPAVTPPEATSRVGRAEVLDEMRRAWRRCRHGRGRPAPPASARRARRGPRPGVSTVPGTTKSAMPASAAQSACSASRAASSPSASMNGVCGGRVGGAFLRQRTDRNPALAVAEDDVGVERDHRRVGPDLGGAGDVGSTDHAQHLSFQAQKRHSKCSGSAVWRGSSSPASQARRICTALSLAACASAAIERHEFVPDLAGVLVDGGEERRGLGQPEIGLVERDLRGVDRLGDADAALGDVAPVLGVRRLALPERRHRHAVRGGDHHAVGMSLHPPAGDGEAELLAVPVADPEIEPGLAQPLDRQVLEDVAERRRCAATGRRTRRPGPSAP